MNRMKWLGAAVVLLLMLGMAAGCKPKVAQQAQTQAPITTDTATAPVVDNLSGTLKVAGSTSVQALSTQIAEAFMKKHPHVRITVAGGSVSSGIKAVQGGTADIGAVSRVLTSQEMSTYKNYLIAMEGVVIIVHPSNKVSGLTLDQARQIFSGQIANWQDVGGNGAAINLFTREKGSGTRSVFQDIVMGNDEFGSHAGIQNSTGDIRSTVSRDPDAVGYISLGDLNQSVKALAIQDVAPTRQTVFNGNYKIARPFFYVAKGEPQDAAKAFIDFVLSPAGQAIVNDMKLVKVR